MGRDKNEGPSGGVQRGQKGGPGQKAAVGIVTFHPTVAEANELREGEMGGAAGWLYLAEVIERNVGVSLGYRAENGAFYAVARDKAGAWDSAPAVSAFHSSLEGCVQALAYGLSRRWPSFPEDFQYTLKFKDEW